LIRLWPTIARQSQSWIYFLIKGLFSELKILKNDKFSYWLYDAVLNQTGPFWNLPEYFLSP
jgi:hypothetical protein